MRGTHGYLSGAGGIRLHYRCWEVATPRAVVVIAHGLGEHSGRYETLAQDFVRAGISAYALDHRGHGRSDGRRGHVRRFKHYIHDFEKFRRLVVGAVGPDVPLLFLGHSAGGLIVIRYLEEFHGVPTRGAVLSAPLLGLVIEVSQMKDVLARILNVVVPALPMNTGLPPEYLSHEPEIVEEYIRDPLVHDRITPRAYSEVLREIDVAFRKAPALRLPILLLVPSGDRIVRPDRAHQFAAALPERKKVRVETYPGLYHEVLNETTRSRVVTDLLGWIERRIAEPRAHSGTGQGAKS